MRFSLELSDEEETHLEFVYAQLQTIKKRYDLSNLENYIAAVVKNYSAVEKPETMSVERLRAFLDTFCLSNFFKQTPHIANMNFLNHKDDQFVRRLELILMVPSSAEHTQEGPQAPALPAVPPPPGGDPPPPAP